MICVCGHILELHGCTGTFTCWATVDDGRTAANQPKERTCGCRKFVAASGEPSPRAGWRRWAVATALMSMASMASIVAAGAAEPLAARMFCAAAAWAGGAVTMFCLARGMEGTDA